MYKNLKAEMARENVTNEEIANAIERNEKTFRNKLMGITSFTLSESMKIRDTFFPKLELEYLFEQSE